MDHQHDTECKCKSTVAVQSLDEMDFERGIWSAGMVRRISNTRNKFNNKKRNLKMLRKFLKNLKKLGKFKK